MVSSATFTAKFTANGTYTWVAPAGVTSASVQAWGSGAGGAAGSASGGGGGGEYAAELTNTVVAGDSYTVVVGAAGTTGNAGNNSSFTGTGATAVTAHGGSVGSGTTGGAGGTGSANSVHHDGGAGGNGDFTDATGGGGGGSGGTSAAGNTGSAGTSGGGGAGGTAVTGGGAGGHGQTSIGTGGTAGGAPGGGGGGGGSASGSAGADGQVIITWTMVSPATIAANTAGGTYQWTAPTGVTSVKAEAWGSGAGGGAPSDTSGAGGGGEYAAEPAAAVTPGSGYTFVAGAAGIYNSGTGTGANGNSSTFTGNSVTVTANGGTASASATAGGAGGTGSTNTVHFNGGAGGTSGGASSTGGGGGGGSGGTSGAGNTGSNSSGGSGGAGAVAVTGGGPGGNGGNSTPTSGSAPASGPAGGGGAGGFGSTGASGFDGQIKLTWSVPGGGILSPQKGSQTYGRHFRRTQTPITQAPGAVATASVALGPLAITGTAAEAQSYGGQPQHGSRNFYRRHYRRQATPLTPPAQTGQMALGPLAISSTATVTENIFPFQPLGTKLELLVNGTWINITSYVYQRANIVITRGRQDETQSAQASQMTLTLNNRGGTFTPKCANSIFFPYIQRNIQMRLSVTAVSAASQLYQGYRFWGEVSSWPPQWDPSGNDVFASITVSGVFRRMTQGASIGSPLTRYYNGLSSPYQPIAWWPFTDASGATQLASGLAGGTPATFTGTPSLAADSQFGGTDPVLELNGAVITGTTTSYGASGDDVFPAPGTFTWICPAGVTTADVKCTAGGGGGGTGNSSQGGGGGGGGEYAEEPTYSVTPGTGYVVIVGSGGAPAGANGGNSTFNGNVVANGGQSASSVFGANGGTGSSNTTHNSGGAGASTTAGTGGYSFTQNFSQTFTSSTTWTAPTGVNSPISVNSLGGGGGGQAGTSGGRAGGGGGGFRSGSQGVSAGSNYTITVGQGGTGGSAPAGSGAGGGNSTFNGAVTGGGGGGGGGNSGGSGGGGATTGGNGGAGHANDPGGGGGGGGAASAGGNGRNGAGSTSSTGGGGGSSGGGKGGNGGGGNGANGQSGTNNGGGGGGGGSGPNGGAGGTGAGGYVIIQYSVTTNQSGSPGTTGGGGGGGSGTSSGAGGSGSVTAGGTGGGTGGAGGVSGPGNPGGGPGGGGGGGDGSSSGTFAGAAGGAGQVEIVYTPPTVPNYNILRFLLQVPAGGGTTGSIIASMFTGGTCHKLNVVYGTGGTLELIGYNSGGSVILDSAAQTFGLTGGVDNVPLLVSAELSQSGTSLGWALTAIQPGAASVLATYSGTVASSTVGNVSEIIINSGGTETKATAVGQVTLQYAYVPLGGLGGVAGGFEGELAGDRFIRLCGEQAIPAQLIPEGYWSFESGVGDWVSANATLSSYTSWASAGSSSLLVTAAGGAHPQASSLYSDVPCDPGDIVSVYADVNAVSALGAVSVNVDFYTSVGSPVSSVAGSQQAMTAGQVATLSNLANITPATTAFARVTVVDNENLTGGHQFAVDNAMIVIGSQMGPQQDDTMMNVLQSIEDLDRGQLFETRNSFGAGYRTRKSMVNQNPKLTLDYSQAQVGSPLAPTYDDQLTRNSIQVTRKGGSSVTAALSSGSMSVLDPPAGVGLYSYALTAVAFTDSQLANLASWLLTLGTVDQERYPQINVDLSRSEVAALIVAAAGLDVGDFLNIINPPVFLPQTEIDQLAYGFTETINAFIWTITLNAVPESPYASGSLPDW